MRLDTPSVIFSLIAGLSSGLLAHGFYAPASMAGFVAMAVLADMVLVRLGAEHARLQATEQSRKHDACTFRP